MNATNLNIFKSLLQGNERFINDTPAHPKQNSERRKEISEAQYPIATVLTCSDSRITPELIFDVGLGELFVIRVAGNIIDDSVMGSIEYSVEHLKVSLVIVQGHQDCGAVKAAIYSINEKGSIPGILKSIKIPADQNDDIVHQTMINNVNNVVRELKNSEPILKKYADIGKLDIIGTYYDLESGKVEKIE
ncbi:carbonic anhydrase [candidate division KSB1 bacterium]